MTAAAGSIKELTQRMESAYAAFKRTGNQDDREQAVVLMRERDAAILARPEAEQAERHAEFERRLDDGVDYFSAQGLRGVA